MRSSSTLTPQSRPSYTEADNLDRYAYVTSRSDVLTKSFVTDLWMRVVTKAIEDIAQFKIMRILNIPLKEEDLEDEESAVSFLFNRDHRIPLDDYIVDVICQKCSFVWQDAMSLVASTDMECPFCNSRSSWKYTVYRITENQTIRDISLEELMSIWGVEDIELFREGCKKNIDKIVDKKLRKRQKSL